MLGKKNVEERAPLLDIPPVWLFCGLLVRGENSSTWRASPLGRFEKKHRYKHLVAKGMVNVVKRAPTALLTTCAAGLQAAWSGETLRNVAS
jgi:hypothetical protein